ncbi:flavin reductase family protein [bacterium]|nr:flavin reductase family protein [bacterium]
MFGFDQTAAAQKSGKRRGRPPTSQGPSFNQAPVPRPVEKELTWTSAIYQAEIERLENAPSPCAVSTSDALGERLDLAVLRMDMRKTLGKTAKSAVIVTTRDKEDTLHPAKGLTVSSFTSVSFYPEIIVSLNLRERSTSLDAIQQSNIFHVHIMKANEQAVEMVSRFACGPRAASGAFKVQRTLATRHAARSERNVEHLLPPFLGGLAGPLDGVASRITCKYMPDKTVEVGDHVVIFGVVQNVVKVDPLPDEQTPYLAYASGSFGSVNPLAMPTFGLRDIREKVEQTVSREALVTRKWEEPPPNSVGADANHQPPIRPYLYTEREVQRIQMARLPETRPLNMTEDPAYEEIERETSWEDKEPLDEAKRKQMQADIDSVMADIEGMFPKKSQMTARLDEPIPGHHKILQQRTSFDTRTFAPETRWGERRRSSF